jgi:glutamate/tyrosine decarboxylase-like PLP-dependent enzyme
MVDDMMDFLAEVRDRPVWQQIPPSVLGQLQEPCPEGPSPAAEVYRRFREEILPFAHGNISPRFWGLVNGSGSATGMLAEMLAAGMNCNSGFGEQAAVHVEAQVLVWMRGWFGFPAQGSGSLVGGCSVANFLGLAAARNSMTGSDVATRGLQAEAQAIRVYGSSETHSSVVRGLEMLGMGAESFVAIPCNEGFEVDVDCLQERIRADRATGLRPIAVVANAGTVNTGATDDLQALGALCRAEDLWLHVDGAFGAMAALAPGLRDRLAGIEAADSIAFDLHKWLHVPYDCGAVLLRDKAEGPGPFPMRGAYLSPVPSGIATGPVSFMQQGLQMSRGFRALKVWFTLQEHGAAKLGRLVQQNVDQAAYLADRIDAHPALERRAPAPLNIVCFRFVRPGAPEEELDAINRAILVKLHHDGIAVPSHTVLHGRFCLRTAVTNHRSRREDFDVLVDAVARLGTAAD